MLPRCRSKNASSAQAPISPRGCQGRMNPGDVAIKREDEGSKKTCNHFRTISKTRVRSAFEAENTCCCASGSPDRDGCPLRDRCETDCAHGAGIGTTGQE